MKSWFPDLSRSDGPRYMAIADVIAMDLKSGKLLVGDRLPPQRELAKRLEIDFTTVARGYVAKLLANGRVARWLASHRQEYLGEFQKIAEIDTLAPIAEPDA